MEFNGDFKYDLNLGQLGEKLVLGALKGYLESGTFRVMQFNGTSDSSFVLLANLSLNSCLKPSNKILFKELPKWISGPNSSALIDRFSGLSAGWHIPKITKDSLSTSQVKYD